MRWITILAFAPLLAYAFSPTPAPPAPAKPTFETAVAGFMKKHCVSCHTGKYAEKKIDLSKIKTAADAKKALTMMKLAAKVTKGKTMPPKGIVQQPTGAERKAFADWIGAQKKS